MQSSLSQVDPSRPEDVRFQLSLLHLLYRGMSSSSQEAELEELLNPPAKLAPANS